MSYLTQLNAQEIVRHIAKIIPNSINIMNTEGVIIAGSVESQVGVIRSSAIRTVEAEEAYIVYRDNEEDKKGITFPIHLNSIIEGVIEINGELDDVMHVGQLVVTLAELMMENNAFHEIVASKASRLNDFFYDWTHRKQKDYDERFRDQASYFDVDLNIKRVAMIVQLKRIRFSVFEKMKSQLGRNDYLVKQSLYSFMLFLVNDADLENRIDRIMAISQDFERCFIGQPGTDVSHSVMTAEQTRRIAEAFHFDGKKQYYSSIVTECMIANFALLKQWKS